MKTKKYTAIIAESYYEEQFLMARFQDVYWRHTEGGGGIIFYVPEDRTVDIKIALEDWRKRVAK
jgi:hypothetical protein